MTNMYPSYSLQSLQDQCQCHACAASATCDSSDHNRAAANPFASLGTSGTTHEYSPPPPPVSPPYIPNRPSEYPPYSPVYGGPYYPPYTPYPPPHASFWSRVGSVLRWPFGRKNKPQGPATWVGGETSPHVVFVTPSASDSTDSLEKVVNFLALTLPSQVYLLLLLRLPSLYFSRVARIFEEADLTLPELKKMALETASRARSGGGQFDVQVFESKNSNLPPQYERLKATWEGFIDSVMREWKTFNIISVLLLSAILTILQIEAAAADPISRYAALFSLICALISLLFGCMYVIRFGSMRKTYKAAEWALKDEISHMVERLGPASNASNLVDLVYHPVHRVYHVLRLAHKRRGYNTTLAHVRRRASNRTFRRYGEVMERAWKQRIDAWLDEKASNPYGSGPHYPHFSYPHSSYPHFGSGYTPFVPPLGSETGYPTDFVPPPGFQMYSDPNLPRYGFASDASGYPTQENPTLLPASSYHPPPEPYDTPDQSRSQSPDSTSSRTDATRANTVRNSGNRASYSRQNTMDSTLSYVSSTDSNPLPPASYPPPPPLSPKIPLVSNFNPPANAPPIKHRLAIPPPPNLPPIPGTPMTAFSNRSLGSRSNGDSPLPAPGEEDVDLQDNRVRFRSPLVSVQGSSGGTATWGGQSPRSVDGSSPMAGQSTGATSSTSRSSPNIGPPSTPLFSGGASSSKESLHAHDTTET
ncbi:hypothetical protein NLJ89_g10687 [Agrocybe chaxingu]|uniref:Uncharacterized protein n=1 Tax=Agrocybe chaxingu TaxID=84603 RepID=A0A9W8JQS6_9AGAR|nr:hypothetical protein NLJ89_g10687 [Agrocybe chaxingu]